MTKKPTIPEFMRENILYIAVFLFCAIYVVSEILEITETGKTIAEILYTGTKVLLSSWLITYALSLQGLISGEKTSKFQDAIAGYSEIIIKITPKIGYLDEFCEKKNEQSVRIVQTHALVRAGLSYKKWIAGEITPKTKEQEKAVKAAESVRIPLLAAKELTSDVDNIQISKGLLSGRGKMAYMKDSNIKGIPLSLVFSIIFGLYTFDLIKDFSWANLIWSALQVCWFLLSGCIKYVLSYLFINDEYRTRIINKTNLLYEFDAYLAMKEDREQK